MVIEGCLETTKCTIHYTKKPAVAGSLELATQGQFSKTAVARLTHHGSEHRVSVSTNSEKPKFLAFMAVLGLVSAVIIGCFVALRLSRDNAARVASEAATARAATEAQATDRAREQAQVDKEQADRLTAQKAADEAAAENVRQEEAAKHEAELAKYLEWHRHAETRRFVRRRRRRIRGRHDEPPCRRGIGDAVQDELS